VRRRISNRGGESYSLLLPHFLLGLAKLYVATCDCAFADWFSDCLDSGLGFLRKAKCIITTQRPGSRTYIPPERHHVSHSRSDHVL